MEINSQNIAEQQQILDAQKAYKAAKESFKSTIKALEQEQRNVKVQRKETLPVGITRFMNTSQAQTTHHLNRYDLKHHYIAYHQFRSSNSSYNKKLSIVHPVNEQLIDKIIKQHAGKTVHLNKG